MENQSYVSFNEANGYLTQFECNVVTPNDVYCGSNSVANNGSDSCQPSDEETLLVTAKDVAKQLREIEHYLPRKVLGGEREAQAPEIF